MPSNRATCVITPRLEMLVGWLSKIDSAKATTNLWGERWSKLVANAMGNGVAASTGMSIKEYMVQEPARHLSIRIAGESVRVGQALGYALEEINGFAPEVWDLAAQELESGANDAPNFQAVEAKLLANAAKAKEGARPSMGQDMLKGRRTEIEFINGLVERMIQWINLDAGQRFWSWLSYGAAAGVGRRRC